VLTVPLQLSDVPEIEHGFCEQVRIAPLAQSSSHPVPLSACCVRETCSALSRFTSDGSSVALHAAAEITVITATDAKNHRYVDLMGPPPDERSMETLCRDSGTALDQHGYHPAG